MAINKKEVYKMHRVCLVESHVVVLPTLLTSHLLNSLSIYIRLVYSSSPCVLEETGETTPGSVDSVA